LLRAQATKGIRSVVITSPVQGEGKTFTAANTAVSLAQLQKVRVLLVDADLRTGGLSHRLGEASSPGLAETLEGRTEFPDAVLASDVTNFSFVPAGKSSVAPSELFASARWKQFMEWATGQFTMVLIDAPPVTLLSDTELIIAAADSVLAVVRTRMTPREVVESAAQKLEKQKLLGVVLNCVRYGRFAGYGQYYKRYYQPQKATRETNRRSAE
jgi:capsular exopolysaccharide synthesis family protein